MKYGNRHTEWRETASGRVSILGAVSDLNLRSVEGTAMIDSTISAYYLK